MRLIDSVGEIGEILQVAAPQVCHVLVVAAPQVCNVLQVAGPQIRHVLVEAAQVRDVFVQARVMKYGT